MIQHQQPDHPQPAFTMKSGDRFHSIIMSEPIRYEICPETETILTFFVIRRASGTYKIVNVVKTFKEGECISRNIQTKNGIVEKDIDMEIKAVREGFAVGVEAETKYRIEWNSIDLSEVQDKEQQISRLKQWGRLNVFGSDILN